MSVQLHVLLDASFFGRKYRLKSALRLCQELDWLHDKYRISHFALTHDLFTVNKDKVREFCMQVAGRGYTWTCSARMDCVDPALLEDMYSAGCRSIYYGVETGSARMQKMVDKHLDLALFAPTLDSSRKVGLAATASFITGFPTKEQSDQDDTLDMIGSCFSRYPAGVTLQLHLLTPEPGTRLMTDFAEFVDYDGHISDFNFPTLESDDRAVIRRHPAVFMNQYFYRTVLPRRQHVFVTAVHPVLYRLGFRVLRHLLSYYNGRYSRLLRSMFDWASTQDQSVPLDNLVCNYMEATWGREHYLTSLVRYLLAAARLEISPLPGAHVVLMPTAREVETTTPKKRKYVLHRAAVLRDLHDCPTILDMLAATADLSPTAIPTSLRAEQRGYLLFRPTPGEARVRNFRLDEAATSLLDYLTVPRSERDYGAYAARLVGAARRPVAAAVLLRDMLQLGVVQLASTAVQN